MTQHAYYESSLRAESYDAWTMLRDDLYCFAVVTRTDIRAVTIQGRQTLHQFLNAFLERLGKPTESDLENAISEAASAREDCYITLNNHTLRPSEDESAIMNVLTLTGVDQCRRAA